jgi:hypothetical protein
MPIILADSINNKLGWSFLSPGLNVIFSNKLYTSTILTLTVLILIMIIYPCKENTPIWVIFKLGFYILIFSSAWLVLHDIIMRKYIIEKYTREKSNDFVGSIGGTSNIATNNDNVDISPSMVYGGSAIDDTDVYVDNNNGDDIAGIGECSIMGGSEDLFKTYGV